MSASSGSFFLKILYHFLHAKCDITCQACDHHILIEQVMILLYNTYFDSFGLPLTVLCQTTGKLVLLAKFWVTAIWGRLLMICVRCTMSNGERDIQISDDFTNLNTVVSMFRTTCHIPPGTKMVSPGCWIHSTGAYLAFNFLLRVELREGVHIKFWVLISFSF